MLDASSVLTTLILLLLVYCGAAGLVRVLAWIFSQLLVFVLVLQVSLSLLSSEILYLSPPDPPLHVWLLGIYFTFVLYSPAAVLVLLSHSSSQWFGLLVPVPLASGTHRCPALFSVVRTEVILSNWT